MVNFLRKLLRFTPEAPQPIICSQKFTEHCFHCDGAIVEHETHNNCHRVEMPYRVYSCCRPDCPAHYKNAIYNER